MERRTIQPYNITVFGKVADIEKVILAIKELPLTKKEEDDRLLLQDYLDTYSPKVELLYAGNSVYKTKKLVAEFKKMQKSGSIEQLSKEMYQFLSLKFDIAHYDRNGYIAYYDGSYDTLYKEILCKAYERMPQRFSDVRKILELAGLRKGCVPEVVSAPAAVSTKPMQKKQVLVKSNGALVEQVSIFDLLEFAI